MINNLRNLFQARDLLGAWAWRIVRVRYQQSLLGGLWAIIQPAAAVVILTVVFTRFVKVDTGGTPYLLFSYTTMVLWTLFSGSLGDMVGSLVNNMNLVTKIYFPREVLPIASMIARLFDFGIAMLLLVAMMVYFQVPLLKASWLYVPVIVAIEIALALGLGFVTSALNVFYRDIGHVFPLGLQVLLYASPIIYPVTMVPENLRSLYFLNPLAGIVESYRAVLLYGDLPGSYLIFSATVALLVLLVGYWFFKRVEFQFADVV
ncbi:Polysialic acid transport protein KpsM [Anaerolineae bacterium]|nr:Polysialic acid transport protein KpsM [Anaerolineae bacterium]